MSLDTASTHALQDQLAASSPRLRLWLFAVGATVAGAGIGYHRALPIEDAQLALLIKFMAIVKLAMVAGAVMLVDWRLKSPTPPRLALFYTCAVAAMALAPGLVWFRSDILIAGVLFHASLIAGFVLGLRDAAWRDRQ